MKRSEKKLIMMLLIRCCPLFIWKKSLEKVGKFQYRTSSELLKVNLTMCLTKYHAMKTYTGVEV